MNVQCTSKLQRFCLSLIFTLTIYIFRTLLFFKKGFCKGALVLLKNWFGFNYVVVI